MISELESNRAIFESYGNLDGNGGIDNENGNNGDGSNGNGYGLITTSSNEGVYGWAIAGIVLVCLLIPVSAVFLGVMYYKGRRV